MRLTFAIQFLLLVLIFEKVHANTIFIAMDETQANHLKAYGIAYWSIEQGVEVDWLLNYKRRQLHDGLFSENRK
jgi:hypothetical protein